jgi:hypothetical protein
VFLLLLVGSTTILVVTPGHAGGEAFLAALPVLLIAYIVVMIAMRAQFNRYQRLYSSGLLRVEAVQSGAVPAQPTAGVWDSRRTQSEFTVPYQARVPIAAPAQRQPADPLTAGTREVTIRRGPLARQILIFAAFVTLFWLGILWPPGSDGDVVRVMLTGLLLGCAAGGTFLLLTVLVISGRFLADPVLARLTPDGWALPYARMHGQWSGVREIRVSALRTARNGRLSAQLPTFRVISLIVDDPEQQLNGAPPLRRTLARRSMKHYGSPVTIVAGPNRTMPAVDLIRLLQSYTDAPVSWGQALS